ncbi:CACP-like protein [Mya arenaria]|uniref:CACP-like protein n=1 Tax=Mya arenaria TaxID=6604 RepID=A0ABY7GBZ6_MYAAR|nr:CACP-like protein [Mya arenaria]
MYSAISRIMARQIAPLTASPALKMSAVKPRRITGRMFSVQASLPRFPVAPLQQTLDKYLQTLRPLLCEDFKTGVGPLLQTKLEERAQKHTNWLSDWWRQVAYLDVRESCVINSNPGVLFPKADFNDLQGQLSQTLPVEHLGKAPLCMMQYYQILSACRIPGVNTDDWVCFPPDQPNPPRHITIVYNNNFFEVPVYDSENKPLNSTQLRAQLEAVVSQGSSQGPPLGLFTMENRENWARAYKNMCKDEVTKSSLESIQRSIVFVVGQDGVSGLNYEHTSAEGPPVIHLMDHCLEYINSGKDWEAAGTAATPRLLTMNLSHDVENSLNLAKENIDRMVQDLDLKVFTFEEFGKNFPKSQRVSPDSFIQSAIQLAYYRHHRKPVGSYESGSIRMFQLGRTETIRSCSSSSLEFTQAMLDPSQSNQKRAELLRRAINSHKQYTNDVPAKSESVLFFGPVCPDGYGFCYNPQEKRILFGISSFKSNDVTLPAAQMCELVADSLRDMRQRNPFSK